MKSGFVSECHVVVYCEGCGDVYREHEGESICFDSIDQAIGYLAACGAGVGWIYDGDKVLCDGCRAAAECTEHGHVLLEPRRWSLGSKSAARVCTRCGMFTVEIEE